MAKTKVPYVLVVVDVQPGFDTAKDVIDPVCKLVIKAIADGMPIVILEFDPTRFDDTYTQVTDLCKGYNKTLVVTKDMDDGSEEVISALRNAGYKYPRILLCGVNFEFCVFATAVGLANGLEDTTVVVDTEAVHGPYYDAEDPSYWDSLQQRYNKNGVKLLNYG